MWSAQRQDLTPDARVHTQGLFASPHSVASGHPERPEGREEGYSSKNNQESFSCSHLKPSAAVFCVASVLKVQGYWEKNASVPYLLAIYGSLCQGSKLALPPGEISATPPGEESIPQYKMITVASRTRHLEPINTNLKESEPYKLRAHQLFLYMWTLRPEQCEIIQHTSSLQSRCRPRSPDSLPCFWRKKNKSSIEGCWGPMEDRKLSQTEKKCQKTGIVAIPEKIHLGLSCPIVPRVVRVSEGAAEGQKRSCFPQPETFCPWSFLIPPKV